MNRFILLFLIGISLALVAIANACPQCQRQGIACQHAPLQQVQAVQAAPLQTVQVLQAQPVQLVQAQPVQLVQAQPVQLASLSHGCSGAARQFATPLRSGIEGRRAARQQRRNAAGCGCNAGVQLVSLVGSAGTAEPLQRAAAPNCANSQQQRSLPPIDDNPGPSPNLQ